MGSSLSSIRNANEMGNRKWEDLRLDCLVNIISRVGVLSLVEDVPLVCKSWHNATLSTLCWQSLIFPRPECLSERYEDWFIRWRYYSKRFVKFVIRRSRGLASTVVFPPNFPINQEVLNYICEGCPSLKRLVLPYNDNPIMLSRVICKLKNMEALEIGSSCSLAEIIPEINVHCKKFVSLSVSDLNITDEIAIIAGLPDIELLSLKGSFINRDELVTILKACKKLAHLEVSSLWGFYLDDEIKELIVDIATFKFRIWKVEDEKSDDYDYDYDDSDYDGSD